VAKWFADLSLGVRLSLFVALIVTGVVTAAAYVEVRSFERDIDRELVDAARLAAQAAAGDLAARGQVLDPLDVRDTLHDLVEADPVVDAIAVVDLDADGQPHVFASTSTEEPAEVVDLGARAIRTGAPASERNSTLVMFALPVPRRGQFGVAVSVGLESLLQARAHGLRIALGFVLPTVVLVTLLVHLLVRQLLGKPLRLILRTMKETGSGDLGARVRFTGRDELGTIAGGLNVMLDQLERFNQSLHTQIEAATSDLSLRNAQLAASQLELLGLRESLARAERVAALGQLAATVAHQAGTPLNLVSGYVQMIRDDPATDERTRSRLRTVDAQIQQVTRVLQTMLDRARQPAGSAIVSIPDIIERVRELAEPRLSRSRIQLRIDVVRPLPPVKGDATQLEMVLLNLVTNALAAMPEGGALSIAARPGAGGVRIEVADTGSGIPTQMVDRVFDPWVTSKAAGEGTGLGLAIVRDVVRAHGGSVSASNQAEGALFVIDLPAAGVEGSAA
jgi:signal transduction histidine kinase